MHLTPHQSKDITKYKASNYFESWYDRTFISRLPNSSSDFLVRQARKKLFPLLHSWATFTENQMFVKAHRKKMSLEERMKKEFDIARSWNGGLLSIPSYRPQDCIFIYSIESKVSNCKELINKGNESEIRTIICKAVQELEELHRRGHYHGDALLKNAWFGKGRKKTLSVQWTGMMQNIMGFSLEESQALDYLNLILSHKKYSYNWADVTAWTIGEVKGSLDPVAKLVPHLLEKTVGLYTTRRIKKNEAKEILKALKRQ